MKILAAMMGVLFLTACKANNDANTNAMQDKSWFRQQKGVDRFYLAYPEFPGFLQDGPEKKGWEILLGLACYDEPKDPHALTTDPSTRQQIPLHKREKLSQFSVIGPSQKPEPGQCRVILGDPYSPTKWNIKVDEKVFDKAAVALMGTGSACLGMAASVVTVALATTGAAAAAPVTAGTSTVATAAVTIPMWASLSAATVGCISGVGNHIAINHEITKNKSYSDLLKGIRDAEILAEKELNAAVVGGKTQFERVQMYRYSSRVEPEKLQKAVAIFNPALVRAFNQQVTTTFEQGWFKGHDFFDAVKELKNDIGSPVSPIAN